MIRAVIICLILALAGCGAEQAAPPENTVAGAPAQRGTLSIPKEALQANDHGVGLMGSFKYGQAHEAFRTAVELAPHWNRARLNLAIATLNRQQPGDEAAALKLIEAIVIEDPDFAAAHYVAGILRFNAGRIDEAAQSFSQVIAADNDDAYAHYYLAQCRLQLDDAEAAAAGFQRAMELDPYLRSAVYGAFLASQRLGDREQARAYLQSYQRLDKNPRSRLAEIKYTRMGPRAEAVASRAERASESRTASVPQWSQTNQGALAEAPPPLSVAFLDDGSRQWLAITGSETVRILDAADGNQIQSINIAGVTALAWGDMDDDGKTDVVIGRQGAVELWIEDETAWHRFASWETGGTVRDVLILDADHDGDLDIALADDADGARIINNNGDGSYRILAGEDGITSPPAFQVSAADVDGDRDLDILSLGPQGVVLHRNDRLWSYSSEPLPALEGAMSMLPVDFGADGEVEICVARDRAVRCASLGEDGDTDFEYESDLQGPLQLAALDADADGEWDLALASSEGWEVISSTSRIRLGQGSGILVGIRHAPMPALLLHQDDALVSLSRQAADYLVLRFSGMADEGQGMRSNRSGLGTRFVNRAGPVWTAGTYLQFDSGAGNSLQPVALGLGGQSRSTFVELDWPDGVFQTELGLEPGPVHLLTETQRQLASCPVLFAWKDGQYRFLSDVLGVGGMGFAVGRGEYARPRPWEHFAFDADQVSPRDGHLSIFFTEPMEETAYLDHVAMDVLELPANQEWLIDERMATDGREPSGRVLAYDAIIPPLRVYDGDRRDQTGSVRALDGVAADPGARHPRFLGFLEAPMTLTLSFDTNLDQLRDAWLLLDGWVEYGYSQTGFAAWQAGISYQPPSLEARGVDGIWRTVAANFGYPAGMPRRASLRLPILPRATRELRITTNQEIYFDRLAVVTAQDGPVQRVASIEPEGAQLEKIGFPRRSDGPQRRPHYDFSDRQPFWDTRYQSGFYTQLGDAMALVAKRDSALAIVGPGDGLRLDFPVSNLPPVAEGMRRVFVLKLYGWAKDMDLYTQHGETVEPLPGPDRGSTEVLALHERFNTRYRSGR